MESFSSNIIKWNHFLKNNEISIIQSFLPSKNSKILEIGGGNGYQSNIFNSLGYFVTSVDIEPKNPQYFEVQKIKSEKLDFNDNEFDIVFSSNVVAHVENKAIFFKEIKRVLKDDGVMIHVVPSSWWSIFTNIWHYLFIPSYFIKSFRRKISKSEITTKFPNPIKNNDTRDYKFKRLFYHPLGTDISFIHEIFKFSKTSWKHFFLSFDFIIVSIENDTMLTTGYGVIKNKLINLRIFFGKIFPSYYYFILKKHNM